MPEIPPFSDLVWPESVIVPSMHDLMRLDERVKTLSSFFATDIVVVETVEDERNHYVWNPKEQARQLLVNNKPGSVTFVDLHPDYVPEEGERLLIASTLSQGFHFVPNGAVCCGAPIGSYARSSPAMLLVYTLGTWRAASGQFRPRVDQEVTTLPLSQNTNADPPNGTLRYVSRVGERDGYIVAHFSNALSGGGRIAIGEKNGLIPVFRNNHEEQELLGRTRMAELDPDGSQIHVLTDAFDGTIHHRYQTSDLNLPPVKLGPPGGFDKHACPPSMFRGGPGGRFYILCATRGASSGLRRYDSFSGWTNVLSSSAVTPTGVLITPSHMYYSVGSIVYRSTMTPGSGNWVAVLDTDGFPVESLALGPKQDQVLACVHGRGIYSSFTGDKGDWALVPNTVGVSQVERRSDYRDSNKGFVGVISGPSLMVWPDWTLENGVVSGEFINLPELNEDDFWYIRQSGQECVYDIVCPEHGGIETTIALRKSLRVTWW